MNYLAIDTSNAHLTVVCYKDGKIFEHYEDKCGTLHSKTLMTTVEDVLIKSGLNLNDVDFFACVVGAGSFTGIRIGVSTIKAFCFAFNKPFLSITSFDTLAYNNLGGKILAVIDARHDGFYVAGYDGENVVFPPSYILKDKLIALSNEYKLVSFEPIKDFDVTVSSRLEGLKNAIYKLQKNVCYDYDKLTPLYCRKSQAEEGR